MVPPVPAYEQSTAHSEIVRMIYDGLVEEIYGTGFLSQILSKRPYASYSYEAAVAGTTFDLVYGILLEIRGDYASNGALINSAIAEGRLYSLMDAFLRKCEKA